MQVSDLQLLNDYDEWATAKILVQAEQLTEEQFLSSPAEGYRSVRDTLVHIFSAEWIWLARWQGESPTVMLQPAAYPDLATLRSAWDEQRAKLTAFVERLDDRTLHEDMDYRTTDGQHWRQPLSHMLQHVVNHGSYHRGQVTTMLRQSGGRPPEGTDLIAFYLARR